MIDLINKVIGDHAGIGTDDDELLLGNVIRIRSTTVDVFDGDNAGFENANAGAASDDVILLPPKTFTSTITITAGVKIIGWSRYSTVLSGQITGTAASTLENLTLARTANDGNTIKGMINTASGICYVSNCVITVTQNGAGNGYAVSMDNNGILECWNCYLFGHSGSGNGYGVFDGGGAGGVVIFGGRVAGSTARFG